MKYRFNDCELDTDSLEFRNENSQIKVEPQVFDLLVYFVENKGKLITRNDLVESVWKGRIVSDSAITARISNARRAVSDNGKDQQVIKTVSRKGFKFLPAVKIITENRSHNPSDTSSQKPENRDSESAQQLIDYCLSQDGTRLAFSSHGQGAPLIRTGHWLTHLEHDWHSPIWRPFLNEMGNHFEVTRYDQRGCGLSDRDISDFSFPRFSEDLDSVVNSAGHDKFILYATSQGVPVAIDYAVRNPERVSHLILHGGYATGRLVRDDSAEVEQGEAILKLIEHGWGITGSPFLKSFTTMYIPNASTEQRDSLVDLQRLSTSATNAVTIRHAVDSFNVSSLLPQIKTKTLIVHSRHDGVHPLSQAQLLAKGIQNSELVILESENHAILSEEPAWARFFWEIKNFIKI